MSQLIPRADHPAILTAVKKLVERHGHPDAIPMGALATEGVPAETAKKCEALLTSEDYPSEAGAAVAKWMRVIGEFSA